LTVIEGIILGLVQGLTEFLPVSSSGHLVLARALLGGVIEQPLLFDVAVHAATLLAIIVYFRREVLSLVGGFVVACLSVWVRFRPKPGSRAAADRRLFFYVLAASAPTAVIALLLRRYVEQKLQDPVPVGLLLVVTGLILYATRKYREPGRQFNLMNPLDAVIVGIMQGIAVLPGVSRSGSTISLGIIVGLEREVAARFSFLIAIPAIAGAAVLELPKLFTQSAANLLVPTLVGSTVAMVTGYVAIAVLIRVLQKRMLAWFAPYCWVVGAVAVVVGLLRR
jgi:undecaprenyl-diphosphatase